LCLLGAFFVFLGAFTIVGFWVSSWFCCCLGVFWGLLLFWVLGFMRVLGVVGCLDFRGSCWVVSLYTPCVPKGALHLFNEISITY
jgi:hypothetical protein